MAKLPAGVRHHGGQTYSYRAYVGHNALTGRPRRRSVTFTAKTREQIGDEVARIRLALKSERAGLAAAGTVAELVDDWLALAERDRSPSTLRKSYRPRAKLIRARFGDVPAVDLKTRDIDAWYTALMTAKKPKTAAAIHELHRVFSAVLQFGVEKDRLARAVTRHVSLPEKSLVEIALPSSEAMSAIWERLPDVPWGRAVQLLAATGMRRGEVVGLRWEDWNGNTIKVRHSVVELEGGGVAVRMPKGKRVRSVTLGLTAQDVLARQRAMNKPGPWVFGDGEGGPARPGWLSLMWGRWRTSNGAPGIGLHGLRHWYATHAIDSGMSPADVAKQLGHAQVSTTMNIYVAPTDDGRQRVADSIDRALTAPT
jgi:integrase